MADRSEDITVEFGENGNAKEITVTDAAGRMVKRIPVKAGEKRVTFSATGLSPLLGFGLQTAFCILGQKTKVRRLINAFLGFVGIKKCCMFCECRIKVLTLRARKRRKFLINIKYI